MTYIKQFTVTAPARVNDLHPFVTLKIREAATSTGTYTIIDTQAWSDATPSTVTATAVETSLATLETGWYQFQWVDGTGALTQWWGPVYDGGGAALFTVAEARTAIGDNAYDQDKIIEARTYAQQELERALGYALLPATVTETVSVRQGQLKLKPYARNITALTVSGQTLSAEDLAELTVNYGTVYRGWRKNREWPDGNSNATVTYTYGLEQLPVGAKRAALALALDYLGEAGTTGSLIDPRATSIVTDDGTIKLDTGGRFPVQVVNDFVMANRSLRF